MCDFYLLAHEHLHVFRKPAIGEKMSESKNGVMRRQRQYGPRLGKEPERSWIHL
jgi:hypothetical protein